MLEQFLITFQILIIDVVMAADNAIIIGLIAANFAPDNRKKIIALGFMDERQDHFLAVCSSLVKNRRVIFVVGKRDVIFHLPNDFSIKLPVNSRISLFPLNEIKTVEAVGLKYPVENLKFSPMGKIGTSNISTSENIRISYQGSGMLGIFSSRHLDIFYNSM